MSGRGYEIILRTAFIKFTRAYVEAFPRAYQAFGADEAGFDAALKGYANIIDVNCEPIYRVTARDISSYLNLYNVHANQSADEFKIIYYLGRAIEKHLVANGLADVAQIHMYAMVGLLDFRLRTKGYNKPPLTKALTKLIKLGRLDEELGQTGMYLIYKCVSTAERQPTPGVG